MVSCSWWSLAKHIEKNKDKHKPTGLLGKEDWVRKDNSIIANKTMDFSTRLAA
jgi:hypothetical protein